MKIAIQGHQDRGNEVIQILESLGGINRMNYSGHYTNYYYYISGDDNTIAWTCIRPQHLGVFTLEEFEKEFPFKIGERVESLTTGLIGTITKFSEHGIYHFKYDNGICSFALAKYLKLYKEMKEERSITLTLDKAKEWYKKGGELKEIALQAYSKEELTKKELPKTYEECCNILKKSSNIVPEIRMVSPEESLLFSKLIRLKRCRDAYWNIAGEDMGLGKPWEPDWENKEEEKYTIEYFAGIVFKDHSSSCSRPFAFPTPEMRDAFYENFKKEIEFCKELL